MSITLSKFILIEYGSVIRSCACCSSGTTPSSKRYRIWVKEMDIDNWEIEGGYFQRKDGNDIILEQTQAEGFKYLDWKKSTYYDADSESGWLSPEGIFWGCKYTGHSDLARFIIRLDYFQMEEAGWVHVDEAGCKGRFTYRYYGMNKPNEIQNKWLKDNGHDTEMYSKRDAQQAQALADQAAYENMMKRAPKR